MKPDSSQNAIKQQRLGFYFAIFNFVGMVIWVGIRVYFAIIGDIKADRNFTFGTLGYLPVWVLCWIIGFVSVGNSISQSKRFTSYGTAALIMLAIPAIPVAIMVITSFWQFGKSL